jgi:hypothetical protein
MKIVIASLLALSSVCFATSQEPKRVRSVSCASGIANPDNSLKAGAMTSEAGMQSLAASMNGTYEVREHDILVVVPVDGTENSFCLNNGVPTYFNVQITPGAY